jgi:hypothetical protein
MYLSIAWDASAPLKNVFGGQVLSRSLPFAAAIVAFTVAWLISVQPRSVPKSKIGLVIGIKAENEVEYVRVRNDFIQTVISLLGSADRRISVLALNEYHTKQLLKGPENLSYYHRRTNSRLMVYGSCCTRMQDGKPFYYLSINSSVSHMPIPIQLSNVVRKHMLEVFPRTNLIAVESELIGFKLMSDYFGLVAMYLLGLSAHVSRDAKLALSFHEPLLSQLASVDKSVKLVKLLKSRCRSQVIMECIELANAFYNSRKDVESMNVYTEKILALDPENWRGHLQRGIYLFVAKRDVEGALRESNLAKNSDDRIWLLNVAFLHAYAGELDKAYFTYRRAFEGVSTPNAHLQTEEFLREVLEREPDKLQLYYCLGLIYYFYRHDLVLAKEAFRDFKVKAQNTQFAKWITYVDKYLSEIDRSI